MLFSDKLRRLMERRGLTQQALGKALGVEHTSVSRWLRKSAPRAAMLKTLAHYFGVPVDVLTDETVPLPDPTEDEWAAMEEYPPTEDQLKILNHNLPKVQELIDRNTQGLQSASEHASKELVEFLLNDLAETKARQIRLVRVLEKLGLNMEGEIAAGTVQSSTQKGQKKK